MRIGPALLSALLVMMAMPPASSAAADGGGGTLPTGEEARPRGPLSPDLPEGPPLVAEGPGGYRALSLAPGRLPLSSRFGWRSDPLGRGGRFHSGVDIPARAGAAVRAVRTGQVVFSGWAGGYGNLVVIDHGGGVRSRYGHLERALVAAGDRVGTGTEIGEVGSTGRSTGPHLHYEVRIGGTAVDPLRAAMQGPEERDFALVWPESDAAMSEVAPRWSWRAADAAEALPAPVMR